MTTKESKALRRPFVKQLLEMHVKATGSAKAAGILADFGAWAGKFRAVISDEYLNWMKEMC